jgi:hypothetical protein
MTARSWEEMRAQITAQLRRQTGHDVEWWNAAVADQADLADEVSLRAWLAEQGVTGYPQGMLVMERFGYPEFMLASADELIEAQYTDRPALRPILDAVVALASSIGEVEVHARRTYVSLYTPRRAFAAVRPTTKNRWRRARRAAARRQQDRRRQRQPEAAAR